MKLGFDIDGVVADLDVVFLDFINETYGLGWTINNLTTYEISEMKFVEDKEENNEIRENCINLINSGKIQLEAEPFPEAVEAIKKLRKAGHSIHFITGRPKTNESHTVSWIRKHKIQFDTIDHVGYEGKKGMLGRSLNLDFYIDDEDRHLKSMLAFKKRWRKGLGLLDKPWNRAYICDRQIIRFKTWKDVLRHLGVQNR